MQLVNEKTVYEFRQKITSQLEEKVKHIYSEFDSFPHKKRLQSLQNYFYIHFLISVPFIIMLAYLYITTSPFFWPFMIVLIGIIFIQMALSFTAILIQYYVVRASMLDKQWSLSFVLIKKLTSIYWFYYVHVNKQFYHALLKRGIPIMVITFLIMFFISYMYFITIYPSDNFVVWFVSGNIVRTPLFSIFFVSCIIGFLGGVLLLSSFARRDYFLYFYFIDAILQPNKVSLHEISQESAELSQLVGDQLFYKIYWSRPMAHWWYESDLFMYKIYDWLNEEKRSLLDQK